MIYPQRTSFICLVLIFLLTSCLPLFPTGIPILQNTDNKKDQSEVDASPNQPIPTKPTTINIAAASSLSGAFQELGSQFEEIHPDTKVEFTFAGSQQLAQQLSQGAPADVFASANQKQMDFVVQAGRIQKTSVKQFVKNRLVVVLPRNNPANINKLNDLARPDTKLILAAKEVPVGQYTLDFLDKASASGSYGSDYKERVLANVVSYENNVRSVLVKVTLGEGDAGIVYASDVTGPDANQIEQLAIPDVVNVIASYPIAPVQDSANSKLAQEYVDLVLSPRGQAVMKKYGFIPVIP
jgi:molybdate transport system substrate-binding protein